MAKEDRQKERLEHVNPGGHLGGTKFGQAPGTGNANHAQPPKPQDKQQTPGTTK